MHKKTTFYQLLIAIPVAIFLIVQTTIAAAKSLPETISFMNIFENKDISIAEGAAVFQDSAGFMWFGGGTGLVRYDGFEFKEIPITDDANPSEKQTVIFARAIFEDKEKTIWVGSQQGLLRYDPLKEKLTQVKKSSSQSVDISKATVWDIDQLPSGELLVGSTLGLFVVDTKKQDYTTITADRSKPNWLQETTVLALLTEKDNVVWIGTPTGLERLDWNTKTFSLFKMNPAKPDSAPENGVNDLISDREGKYWIATRSGLVHFDPTTLKTIRYQNNAADKFSIGSSEIWKILLDSKGLLWAATDGGGLALFNKEENKFINYKFEPGRIGSINTNAVRTVFEDRNGDIWTGNFPTGVNFFDRSSAAIVSYSRDLSNPNSLGHNGINPVKEDANGNLWIGTDGGGLDFFDRNKGEFTHFKNDPNNPNTVNGNSVLAMCIDSKGLIWTGVWDGGVAYYNPMTKTFTRLPYDKQRNHTERVSYSSVLNDANVWSIREDKNYEFWITTLRGGISKYNPATNQYVHYAHISNDPQSISSSFVWTTLEDSEGNVWAGASNGLNLLDKERKGIFTRFLPDPNDPDALKGSNVYTLLEDSKKRLWVGTDAGLSLRDASTGKFTTVTKRDGLLNDSINKIIEDEHGVLWLGTANGFSSYNPDTKAIKNYNRVSGRLVGAISVNSGTTTKRGEVIFGGPNGLRVITPKALAENEVAPPVVLTDLKIFADSVAIGAPDGLLTNSINHTEKIVLNYRQSLFVIEFSALNYRDSAKNKYTYMLKGFDKDWMAPSDQRSAKYTNLTAGTYSFKVKASNNDGVWNENGKSITIIQLPPPWKTWWAYTIYTIISLSIVLFFIYSQIKKRRLIEEQNRILEIKVTERTAEVREKSKDIQDMLTNIPQGLFTVLDNGKIHPEYSRFLEKIFNTQDIAGRNVNNLLFNKSSLGSDVINSAKESIYAIIGEDEINFMFNQSLLVKECSIEIDGQIKHLSIDWNPIVVDSVVNKLMVSVRDVTELKQMEKAAQQQKRQLDIVSQLLNIAANKYLNFESSALAYVKANREAIKASPGFNTEVVALLFRNMHTIKGNCRTFGFSYLSNLVHDAESAYSMLKTAEEPIWNPEQLLSDLDNIEAVIAEYADVYRSVLGRGDNAKSNRSEGFWVQKSTIEKIRSLIDNEEFERLRLLINQLNAISLEQNLADVISSLNSIASQLDKEVPTVIISPNKILIKDTAQDLIRDIFAHILRNNLDHGLETTEERERLNKPAQGTISISVEVVNNSLHIGVSDDGRGLNLPALFTIGIKLGLWSEIDSPQSEAIAQLIFHSGVSTKDVVSDISGRGVGMDAVKQFLANKGGNASIRLLNPVATKQDFVPFELIVSLPEELFLINEA